jgi:Bacterial PH domain
MRTLRASLDKDLKAQRGLPEALPKDEHILWQGSPDWKLLARHVFHTRKLILYFAVLLLMRGIFVLSETASPWAAGMAVIWMLPAFAFAWLCMVCFAHLTAATTMYTITDRRVVMRIGIVLSLSFNLPFRQIEGAGLKSLDKTFGDIALQIAPPNRLAFMNFWPHVRPWKFASAQPMLRCVPDAAAVAQVLAQAWMKAVGQECNAQSGPVHQQAAAHEPARQPRSRMAPVSALAEAA